MSDLMRPLPFKELILRIIGEYGETKSIFGIPNDQFFIPSGDQRFTVFNESCALPLGPAAGPHTQLAQNIVTSYLTGARFIELKTVQILDTLEIEKPCIDASDEGFNTEWSSEYTLTKAYDEYLKAWFLLHLIQGLLGIGKAGERDFIFNMSVGYNLEGIQNPRVDRFIEDLKDASGNAMFSIYIKELQELLDDESLFRSTDWNPQNLKALPQRIPPGICSQLTLSTMHGCPPHEIEKICKYMLREKGLDTFVKLNPTLLGYDMVNSVIQGAGFDYIQLSPQAFSHDLQYADAIPMLSRLLAVAGEQGRFFGVKLTNTLGTVNGLGRLPGEEMYMSGRLLYPLSINLAARLAGEFKGKLIISFSGGISMHNMEDVIATGIRPITLATELLKPGGYLRLKQLAEILQAMDIPTEENIDLPKLEALAQSALTGDYMKKDWRGEQQVSVFGDLPLTDCYVAPCKAACPIGQDAPEYIELAVQGRYAEALELIYAKNPLPSITGHICAHQCQYNCTRRDYEGAVEIREVKKIVLERGFADYTKGWKAPEYGSLKAAVIGAGPAGLAAAYFLARRGVKVTVFEEHDSAGGVVKYQIPHFRISREAIEKDVDFIKAHGVEFRFNHPFDFNTNKMLDQGYDALFLAVGADRVRDYSIPGGEGKTLSSHSLIGRFNRDSSALKLGKQVVVVGAGDTAMDAAQTALRCPGVEGVTLAYRRSQRQMPCTDEEYQGALKAGVNFLWLHNPEEFDSSGALVLRKMKLGDADESGRRRPLPTEELVTIPCDTLIPSIGEAVDYEEMVSGDLSLDDRGSLTTDDKLRLRDGLYLLGDGRTGPTTIVNCMAEARRAVDAFAANHGLPVETFQSERIMTGEELSEINLSKGSILSPLNSLGEYDSSEFVKREAQRCLQCNYLCNKCVQVCPNRANAAIEVKSQDLAQSFQIIHLDGYCNECGNCATFCPWQGKPYRDKITLFSRMDDFDSSPNPGFFLSGRQIYIRLNGSVQTFPLGLEGEVVGLTDLKIQAIWQSLYIHHPYLFGPVEE